MDEIRESGTANEIQKKYNINRYLKTETSGVELSLTVINLYQELGEV